jgi:hypothetical protein
MKSNREIDSTVGTAASDANLDVRYGRIGISAVAAAMRYCPERKNPAYAPAPFRNDKETAELAA